MSSSVSKNLPSTNKIYCEDCKAQIPKSLWSKHQFCQRHLRARASGLFYQKRRGKALADEAKKKLKEDPDALFDDPRFQVPGEALGFEPAEVRKSDLVTTKGRVKGVWVLLQDTDTGAAYYKNRLSGKIQRNRPIGLRDEDLEIELIATAGDESAPVERVDEGEESKPGEWQDVNAAYYFGGTDEAEPEEDPAVKPFFEAESEHSEEPVPSDESDQAEEGSDSNEESGEAEAEKTQRLRTAEEHDATSEAIVEKPVFQEVPQTVAATFPKRAKKPTLQL